MHGHWAPDAPSQISFSRLACLNTHPEKLYEQKWEVGGGGLGREGAGGRVLDRGRKCKEGSFLSASLSSRLSKQSMPYSDQPLGCPTQCLEAQTGECFLLDFSSPPPSPIPSIRI
jgi:hypothetical protein